MNIKNKIHKEVAAYYADKVKEYGATSLGVDWNGEASHHLRFRQLTKLIRSNKPFSVLDYGCGYGSLIGFLNEEKYTFSYTGFDISEAMISKAKQEFPSKNHFFTFDENTLKEHDYVIANGIFNVKQETEHNDWKAYVKETIHQLDTLSEKGFAFNILTAFSDEDYKKDYLFYADPGEFFNYCKNNFSRNVSLLHDYDLYEFTILVRK